MTAIQTLLTTYDLAPGTIRRSDTGIAILLGRRLTTNIAFVLAHHPLVYGPVGVITETLRDTIVRTGGIDLTTDFAGFRATLVAVFQALSRSAVVRRDAIVFARSRRVATDIALLRAHHVVVLRTSS